MTTDPSTLPQWKGSPVPWVTRWTKEIAANRYSYTLQSSRQGGLRLTYGTDNEDRQQGVLWQREGIRRGGDPDWANVSTYRQRSSMRRRLCQVCGSKITDSPIRWLMPPDGLEEVDEGVFITMQPPTCAECIPLALDLCPNLKKYGYQILKVIDYEPWGVYGHVVTSIDGQPRRFTSAICFDTSKYGDKFTLGQVMAQQSVVQLGKFVVEENNPGSSRPEDPIYQQMMANVMARTPSTAFERPPGNVYPVPDDGGGPLEDVSERPSIIAPQPDV